MTARGWWLNLYQRASFIVGFHYFVRYIIRHGISCGPRGCVKELVAEQKFDEVGPILFLMESPHSWCFVGLEIKINCEHYHVMIISTLKQLLVNFNLVDGNVI